MKSRQYYELVQRYEQEAKTQPKKFHRRLRRQLWLGYGYIFFVLLVSVLLVGGLGWWAWSQPHFVTFLLFAVVALYTLQSVGQLFTPLDPMSGVRLTADQYPILFKEIDSLREQMDIPAISDVVLTHEMNAGAGEYRSWFFFGEKRRFLGIGLPLFKTLTADEMRSVIAHEIAHLARGHSQLTATLWHLRTSWFKLLSSGGIWWSLFARYYGYYLEAMAAVLSREYEFEADRIAFESVGRKATISGQLWIELLSHFSEFRFQQWLDAKSDQSSPPDNAVSELLNRLEQTPDQAQSLPLLRRALAAETSIHETHPSRKDRIVRAGFPTGDSLQKMADDAWDVIQNRPPADAAEHFLRSNYDSLVQQLNEIWKKDSELMWSEIHLSHQQHSAELEALDKEIAATEAPASEFQMERRCNLVANINGADSGHEAFQELLVSHPNNPAALFYCGNYAYYQTIEPELAESYFLKAMEADPRYESAISAQMVEICRELEKPEDANQWQEHSFSAADTVEESLAERSFVHQKDKFLPAELTEEQRELIVSQLSADKRVERIWAARKEVEYYSEKPVFVFGIEVTYRSFAYYHDHYFDKILAELLEHTRFPHDFFVLHLHGEGKVFRKKFKKLGQDTSCIFSKT